MFARIQQIIVFIAIILALALAGPAAFAQGPAPAPLATVSAPQQVQPPADTLKPTLEQQKALKAAYDAAQKSSQVLQSAYDQNEAAKAKLQAVYWEIVAKLKIDTEKYDLDADAEGNPVFVPKKKVEDQHGK
jgi:uncharacterized membrane protein